MWLMKDKKGNKGHIIFPTLYCTIPEDSAHWISGFNVHSFATPPFSPAFSLYLKWNLTLQIKHTSLYKAHCGSAPYYTNTHYLIMRNTWIKDLSYNLLCTCWPYIPPSVLEGVVGCALIETLGSETLGSALIGTLIGILGCTTSSLFTQLWCLLLLNKLSS